MPKHPGHSLPPAEQKKRFKALKSGGPKASPDPVPPTEREKQRLKMGTIPPRG